MVKWVPITAFLLGTAIAMAGASGGQRHAVEGSGGRATQASASSQAEGNVTPQMYGAKADGHADDTAAIQKAIDSGKKVYLPEGTYLVGGSIVPGRNGDYLQNRLLTLRSDLVIAGAGKKTIIFLKDHLLDGTDDKTSNAHIFGGYDVQNVTISGIQFNMNGAHNLTPAGKIRNAMAIFVMGGKNVTIEHNNFYNCAGRNVISLRTNAGSGGVIRNNEFRNGGHYVGTPVENVNNTDFSFVYTEWSNSAVDDNWIEEDDLAIGLNTKGKGPGGIELHGSDSHANGNTIIGTIPAIYVAADIDHSLANIEVRNNKIRNSVKGIIFIPGAGDIVGAKIVQNELSLTQAKGGDGGACYGLYVQNAGGKVFDKQHGAGGVLKDLTITGNVITNAFPLGTKAQCAGMMLHSLQGADISGNTITGLTGSGILLLGSPWGSDNVRITGNKILDCGSEATDPYKASLFVSFSGSSEVPARKFHAEGITITGNTLGNSGSGHVELSGITLPALQGSDLKNIEISNNIFQGVNNKLSDGHRALAQPATVNPEVHFKP